MSPLWMAVDVLAFLLGIFLMSVEMPASAPSNKEDA